MDQECQENAPRLHTFIKDVGKTPPRFNFSRTVWSGLIASEPALVYSA